MEKEKKSHKGLLFIFILILMGGTFYLGLNFDKVKTTFNEKILKKETKKEEPKEEEKVEPTENIEDNTLIEIEKAMEDTRIENMLVSYKSLDELTNQQILNFALGYLPENKGETFTAEELRKALDKTILKNLEYQDEDIIDPVLKSEDTKYSTAYFYDKESKTYKTNPDLQGNDGSSEIGCFSTTIGFNKNNNQYIIEKANVYGVLPPLGPLVGPFFGKYEDVIAEKNALFDLPNTNFNEDDENYDWKVEENQHFNPADELFDNYDKYKDKVTKTTFVFEKQDGQLVLVSFKKN